MRWFGLLRRCVFAAGALIAILPAGLQAQEANTGHPPPVPPVQRATPANPHDATAFYPDLARRLGEEGNVIVSFTVKLDGTVSSPVVTRSSGYDRLDQAALVAVRTWLYKPATQGGQPVVSTVNAQIEFGLHDPISEPSSVVYPPLASYPPDALASRTEGDTAIRLLIGANGIIARLQIDNSSGFKNLDSAAVIFVRSTAFAPLTFGGKPVATSLIIDVSWRLPEHADTGSAR